MRAGSRKTCVDPLGPSSLVANEAAAGGLARIVQG